MVNLFGDNGDGLPIPRRSRPPVDLFEREAGPILSSDSVSSALRVGKESGLTSDKERSRRILKTALRLGVDKTLVGDHLEEAEKVISDREFDPESFKKSSPIYARWLAESPHHFAVTAPDKGKIRDLEKLYARKDDPLRPLSDMELEYLADVLTDAELERRNTAANLGDAGLGFTLDPDLPTDEAIAKMMKARRDEMRGVMMDRLREYEAFVAGKGPAEAFETPRGPGESGLGDIPGIGGVFAGGEWAVISDATKAVEAGTATPEQKAKLLLYGRLWTASDLRGTSFWGKVGEGVAALPGYAAEFAMTGPFYSAGKVAAQAAVKRALRKVMGRIVGGMAEKAIGVTAGVTVGGLAQTAAQTAFYLPADTLRRMIPGIAISPGDEGDLQAVIAEEGDDLLPALAKAFGARAIENLSERSGKLGELLTSKLGGAKLKAAIARRWLAKNPEKGVPGLLKEVRSATGWNGPLGEVFEERVGELGRAATGIEELDLPGLEDLVAEAVTFAIPTLGGATLRGSANLIAARSERAQFSAIQKALRSVQAADESPEAMADLMERISSNEEHSYSYLPIKVWEKEWGKIGEESEQQGGPRARALALGVSPGAYDAAKQTGGDLQFSTAAFALRVLRAPEGDRFVDHVRFQPLTPTLPEAEEEAKEEVRSPQVSQEEARPEVSPEAVRLPEPSQEEAAALTERTRLADQALEEAGAAAALDTLFPERYREAIERVRGSAREALVKKLSTSIRRRRAAGYNEERNILRGDVEKAINERPEYRALSILKTGLLPSGESSGLEGIKLSRKWVREEYGFKPSDLPRGILTAESVQPKTAEGRAIQRAIEGEGEGFHPDEAAELLGFRSGAHLLQSLVDAEFSLPREVAIERATDAEMAKRGLDLEIAPEKIREAAQEVLHSLDRSKIALEDARHLLAEEFAASKGLIRKIAGAVPKIEDIRTWAEEEVRKATHRSIKPEQYQRAADKAKKAALDEFFKGNYEGYQGAFERKLEEVRAVELARAASKLKREATTAGKFIGKFRKTSARKRLGKAGVEKYLAPIDDIHERFEFGPASGRRVEDRQSFREWYENEKKENEGREPVVPPSLLVDAYRKNWRDLPISELLEIRDTVKRIAHLAKTKNRMLTSRKRARFEEAVELGKKSIAENFDGKGKPERIGQLTRGQRIKRAIAKASVSIRKFSSFLQELDGWKNGFLWNLLGRPLNERQELEAKKTEDSQLAIAKIFGAYSAKERRSEMHRKAEISQLGVSLSRWDLIALALNWGNLENRAAIMGGYGWTEEQVNNALRAHFDSRDWKAVQGTWDHLESFWPEIKALSERVDGLAPDKVEALGFSIETRDGQTVSLKGGYYPLKYVVDSTKPRKTIEEIAADSMKGTAFRASTKHAHRNNRVGSGGQKVRLEMSVLQEHVRDAIHDLTHYEWLIDANRVLRNPELGGAIREALGEVGHQHLIDTVNAIAVNNRQYVEGAHKFFEWLARRTRAAFLVGSVSTFFKQYLGLAASVRVVGAKWIGKGFAPSGHGLEDIKDIEAWMGELSTFMATRRGAQDRDVREGIKQGQEIFDQKTAITDVFRKFERYGYGAIAWAQWHVDRVTWLGAYQRYAEELGLEKAASAEERKAIERDIVAQADQAVRDSQGSGLLADLPAVMRSRGLARLFTIFQTFMVGQLNVFIRHALPAARRPSISTISQAAATFIGLYVIPEMLWDLFWETARGDTDDDPESLAAKAARTGLSEFAGSIPYGRDFLAPAVERAFRSEDQFPFEGPAGYALFADALDLVEQVAQWEFDETLLRSAVRTAGFVLPGTAQIDRFLSGYLAWRDEEGEVSNLVFGRPRHR